MIATGTIEERLRSLVGAQHIRPGRAEDVVRGVQPSFVVEPGNERELADVLRSADESGIGVIPRGGATKLSWGNPPRRADLILSTTRLNRVIEHAWADLTVTVESGCTIQKLQETLAQHGQRLALDALWPERATVGGILSSNDTGALRLRFGGLRDLIIGVTLALPDGTLASSGGKVVKNVAGYDLPKLATGALGTLGVITRAIFRLHPLPKSAKSFCFLAKTTEEMQDLVLAIQDSKLAHTSFQALFAGAAAPEAHILFEATEAGLSAQATQLRSLLGQIPAHEVPSRVWNARQELWTQGNTQATILKITLLPADIAKTVSYIENTARSLHVSWHLVVQATGIGWLRLEPAEGLGAMIEELRTELRRGAGSLVVLQCPTELQALDSWGDAGDTLSVMRALKNQLDRHGTLNPGRFVGCI